MTKMFRSLGSMPKNMENEEEHKRPMSLKPQHVEVVGSQLHHMSTDTGPHWVCIALHARRKIKISEILVDKRQKS